MMVCEPAIFAEMPGTRGVVIKTGHFVEIGVATQVAI